MAKRPEIPYAAIAQQALLSALTLVERWLPGGQLKNNTEYFVRNPLRKDSKPNSFAINVVKGKWGDFATGDEGRDLISLYAYIQGLEQWEAAIDVADEIGFKLPEGCRPETRPDSERKKPVIDPSKIKDKKPKEESPWHPITPVPADAAEPHRAHPKRGFPDAIWTYFDAEGCILGYARRKQCRRQDQLGRSGRS